MSKANLIYSDDPYDMGYTEEHAKESYKECNGEEPTQSQLECWINDEMEFARDSFECEMKNFLKRHDKFILFGTFGAWDGPKGICALVDDLDDLQSALSLRGDNTVTFEDVSGKLIVTQSHHDGTNYYELRPLTKKGLDHYNNNYVTGSRNTQLRMDLATVKCYTKNANYAKTMWGA